MTNPKEELKHDEKSVPAVSNEKKAEARSHADRKAGEDARKKADETKSAVDKRVGEESGPKGVPPPEEVEGKTETHDDDADRQAVASKQAHDERHALESLKGDEPAIPRRTPHSEGGVPFVSKNISQYEPEKQAEAFEALTEEQKAEREILHPEQKLARKKKAKKESDKKGEKKK